MTSLNNATKSGGMMTNLLLIGAVIVLAIIPLFMHPESEFGGADGQAEEVITEIQPDVEPWFEPFWEPPGGETRKPVICATGCTWSRCGWLLSWLETG